MNVNTVHFTLRGGLAYDAILEDFGEVAREMLLKQFIRRLDELGVHPALPLERVLRVQGVL